MDQYYYDNIQEWERGLEKRNMERMYKTSKRDYDPRKKAFEDYRHHRNTKWIYDHECKFVRKQTTRKLRRKLRKEIYNEAYYKVSNHDYKTYGWITW